jgi:hypothetical protein
MAPRRKAPDDSSLDKSRTNTMNTLRWLVLAMASAIGLAAGNLARAADINFSLSIGEPDFFGRLDVGDFQPQLINRRPVIIERVRSAPPPPPVYLRVRPGEERNWKRNCRKYDACGAPVYFVRDNWYRTQYAPRYRERHAGPRPDDNRYNRDGDRRDGPRGEGPGGRPDDRPGPDGRGDRRDH